MKQGWVANSHVVGRRNICNIICLLLQLNSHAAERIVRVATPSARSTGALARLEYLSLNSSFTDVLSDENLGVAHSGLSREQFCCMLDASMEDEALTSNIIAYDHGGKKLLWKEHPLVRFSSVEAKARSPKCGGAYLDRHSEA